MPFMFWKSKKRYRYLCAGKAMHRNNCDGQTAYTSSKVDKVVLKALEKCFKVLKETPRDIALKTKYEAELKSIKSEIRQLKKERDTQKVKLGELTEEIANALIGESKFTPEILSIAIDKCKDKITEYSRKIVEKEKQFNNQEDMLKVLKIAIDVYNNSKDDFKLLIDNAMSYDVSFDTSAREYEDLYKKLLD